MKPIIAILLGIWCIWASIVDSDFFFENMRVRFFVKILGREGARILYVILGIILILLGKYLLRTG